ncbi:MAG: hypothetical protein ACTHWA_05770 [Arachnia sp.]
MSENHTDLDDASAEDLEHKQEVEERQGKIEDRKEELASEDDVADEDL